MMSVKDFLKQLDDEVFDEFFCEDVALELDAMSFDANAMMSIPFDDAEEHFAKHDLKQAVCHSPVSIFANLESNRASPMPDLQKMHSLHPSSLQPCSLQPCSLQSCEMQSCEMQPCEMQSVQAYEEKRIHEESMPSLPRKRKHDALFDGTQLADDSDDLGNLDIDDVELTDDDLNEMNQIFVKSAIQIAARSAMGRIVS